jgi:Cysteine rich repeat
MGKENVMEKRNHYFGRGIYFFAFLLAGFCVSFCLRTDVLAKDMGPCAGDVEKFCKGVEMGGGRVAKCLKEHESELSAACKERTLAIRERTKEIHQACEDDVTKFCKDVQPGRFQIKKCLKEHESDLSPDCREKMSQGRKRAR